MGPQVIIESPIATIANENVIANEKAIGEKVIGDEDKNDDKTSQREEGAQSVAGEGREGKISAETEDSKTKDKVMEEEHIAGHKWLFD